MIVLGDIKGVNKRWKGKCVNLKGEISLFKISNQHKQYRYW